ncbi:MAG: ATP-grasp domain-containing protein [Candidatus Latescibacteria bacterium]|nr:ATP-grasp domain-containing protein [Candidatus Latescibacterota bacterium]
MASKTAQKRLLLLMPTTTYRAEPFLEAAQRLGLDVIVGSDRCHRLADYWHIPLALKFRDPDRAVLDIIRSAQEQPVHAIVPVDDRTTVIAARASAALGLPHNSAEAADAARNKRRMRELVTAAGVRCPAFAVVESRDEARLAASRVAYPCVLKPLLLSASRGVIRADTPDEFVAAFDRIQRILFHSPDLPSSPDPDSTRILVEQFIPGREVAVEGLLTGGRLRVLAVFDKPDPLDGPFFEETIYVTPSRLPQSVQDAIIACTSQAARAIGLSEGPVHAELRVNETGPWIIEVAGRSIGGLCSRTLRFGLGITLEELILRHAFGLEVDHLQRQGEASGVMMIPVPATGILKGVEGVANAKAVPGIEDVQITAKPGQMLVPLPEGASYPGFIFARGKTPGFVEKALRRAHRRLRFDIVPQLPVAGGG